jgi:hypothetical protein
MQRAVRSFRMAAWLGWQIESTGPIPSDPRFTRSSNRLLERPILVVMYG